MDRPPFPVIDVDGHINEKRVDWAARMPAEYRDLAPRPASGYAAGGERFLAGGVQVPSDEEIGFREGVVAEHDDRYWVNREGMFDPDERLKDMDVEGIDTAVLFGGPVGVVTISCLRDPDLATAVSRAYNDWLATEYCGANAARLKGVAALPMQDPGAAAREVHRARSQGHVAVMTLAHIYGKCLHHPDFDPVWQAAQESGMPVCVHIRPAQSVGADLFDHYVLKRPFFSMDLMAALNSLCLGGVMDRFPDVRFGFMEGGTGWLPWFADKLQETYELYPSGLGWVKEAPMDRLRGERVFFTIDSNDPYLPAAIEKFGAGHFMYASDYAHPDCICPETVTTLWNRQDLSPGVKRQLLHDNAARFLNL
jgi:predicted TIM-barrel fold metal-dependent hydrolase